MSVSSSGPNRPLIETLGYIFHQGRLEEEDDGLTKVQTARGHTR